MSKLFIASTGQNVGKTTSCLGLFSGLQKRFSSLGFIKPLGQQWVEEKTGKRVDKDILLFQNYFRLFLPPSDMSPVLLPQGFTKKVLDEQINTEELAPLIDAAFKNVASSSSFTLIEGTGHMGVGSLIHLNNAQVAKRLDAPMVLIAPGGVGSTFDSIALNKALCDQHGVKIVGVILNKIKKDKLEMVKSYMTKALAQIGLPLLGCITYNPFLSQPTLKDFETLFQTELIAGREMQLHHFESNRLIATSVEVFEKALAPNQLLITHGAREEIILATLSKVLRANDRKEPFPVGLILTGHPPRGPIINQIKKANIPCLISSENTFSTMRKISAFVAKIGSDDVEKIEEAIHLVEASVDFETLLQNMEN